MADSASGAPGAPSDELVEVVDADGRVIDVVTRAEMGARNLRHRCSYIGVVTSSEELVVHQRAAWKLVYPGWWDVCFGGIAGVGEPWDEAARRELAEEAGIVDQPLVDLGPVSYDAVDGRSLGRLYLVYYDGPLTCPDGEVVALDRVPLDSINDWLDGRQVCHDSRTVALPVLLAHLADKR